MKQTRTFVLFNLLGIFTLLLPLLFIFNACNPEPNIENEPYNIVLGHRGSGSDSFQQKDSLLPIENTYEAMEFAFSKLGGAETDIQMSTDGTIWLWHDDYVGTETINCIPCLSDEQILELLPEEESIAKLSDVVQLLANSSEKRFLSLDVKGYFTNCSFDHTPYFDRMSDSIISLATRFGVEDRLMVETNYSQILDFIKSKNARIDCYLLGYTNFTGTIDKASEKGYAGVSFNFNDSTFNETNLEYLRERGLKIQLWSIYSANSYNQCLALKPNFIQAGYFGFLEEDSVKSN